MWVRGALRKPFVAPEYGSGCVVVPPIMAEAVATLPAFTTLSFPLIVGHDIIGAVTVGRLKITPFVDYSAKDVRVAAQLARAAAPLLARAQRTAEHARALEHEFTVSLPDEVIAKVRTVQDVIDLVRERTGPLSGAG